MTSAFTILKSGGETVKEVKGCDRSVAVGVASSEYARMLGSSSAPITAFTVLGGSLSVSCGRLSYMFGFTGPSYSVDTACSASLVSMHLSGGTLQSRESDSSASPSAV